MELRAACAGEQEGCVCALMVFKKCPEFCASSHGFAFFPGFLTENLQAHHDVSWLWLQVLQMILSQPQHHQCFVQKYPAGTQFISPPSYHSLRLNPQGSPRALWMGELKGKRDIFVAGFGRSCVNTARCLFASRWSFCIRRCVDSLTPESLQFSFCYRKIKSH